MSSNLRWHTFCSCRRYCSESLLNSCHEAFSSSLGSLSSGLKTTIRRQDPCGRKPDLASRRRVRSLTLANIKQRSMLSYGLAMSSLTPVWAGMLLISRPGNGRCMLQVNHQDRFHVLRLGWRSADWAHRRPLTCLKTTCLSACGLVSLASSRVPRPAGIQRTHAQYVYHKYSAMSSLQSVPKLPCVHRDCNPHEVLARRFTMRRP